MYSAVASRYARALADIAFDAKSNTDPDRISAELGAFVATVQSSPELRTVFASPAISHAKKRAVTAKIAERLELSRVLKNFLFVVIGHGRTKELKGIDESLQLVVDERRGIARAAVVSAAPLSESEKQSLEQQLAAMTGKGLRALYSVDPKLLGGAMVKIGSQVYDGSVRGRLNAIGARLTATV